MPIAPAHAEPFRETAVAPPAAGERSPYQVFQTTKNFASLNGVRAFCFLWVVKAHAGWNTGVRILDTPGMGVEMFFAISGFLIVTLLIREREKTGTISLSNFYARRSLRIFPIYYGSIFLVMVFAAVLALASKPGVWHFYRWAFVVLLTYTQDVAAVDLGSFHPCWSLAIEEQFYLLWPTVEKLLSTAARWSILLGMILLSELVNFGFFNSLIRRVYNNPDATTMPLFMITLAPIAFGVCLAYLYSEPRTFKRVYRVLGFRWSPFVWIACLIAAFYFAPADLAGFPRLAIQCSLALLLGSLVIREDHYAARFLQWPLLARIGAISYGLYLYHEWIIDYSGGWIDRLLQRLGVVQTAPMLRFAAITAICIAVAEVSFRFIESPILRVRARFQSTQ